MISWAEITPISRRVNIHPSETPFIFLAIYIGAPFIRIGFWAHLVVVFFDPPKKKASLKLGKSENPYPNIWQKSPFRVAEMAEIDLILVRLHMFGNTSLKRFLTERFGASSYQVGFDQHILVFHAKPTPNANSQCQTPTHSAKRRIGFLKMFCEIFNYRRFN